MRHSFAFQSPSLLYVKQVLFILALFVFPLISSSQSREIDSLKVLLSSRNLEQRKDLLTQIGYAFLTEGDYENALMYSDTLLTTGHEWNDSLQIVRGWIIRASILRRTGKIDSAMHYYNKMLPVIKRQSFEEELKHISNSVGLLYAYAGRYDKALDYLFESLSIRERQKNDFEIAVALHNIGFVYYKLGNIAKAIEFYRQALELKRKVNTLHDLDLLLVNLSLCHIRLRDFTTARQFIQEGFASCGDTCTPRFLMHVNLCEGVMHLEQADSAAAILKFSDSYNLARQIDDIRFQLDNLSYLALINTKQNNLKKTEKYLKEAQAIIARDARYKRELIDIYSEFADLYKKLSDHKRVSLYQEKYIALQDSLFSVDVTTNLMTVESNYIEKKKQAEIESQNKILTLNEEIIFRQRIANGSIAIIALLVTVLAIILIQANRKKKAINVLLDQKVAERTRELEQDRELTHRSSHERELLVKKMVSDIRGSVATIKGLCVAGLMDIDHPNAADYLNKMNNASDQLSEQLGRMFYPGGNSSFPNL